MPPKSPETFRKGSTTNMSPDQPRKPAPVAAQAKIAPSLTANEEAQNDEIEVLRSIYMDDYTAVETKTMWSNVTERSFKLRLLAYSDTSISLVLLVTTTLAYPKVAPVIMVQQHFNVRAESLDRVRALVAQRPKELIGEVMVHQIADEVREILEDSVAAHTQDNAIPSLEEERIAREEVGKKQAEADRANLARRLEEEKADTDRRLQRELDDHRKALESAKPKRTIELLPGSNVIEMEKVLFDDTIKMTDEDGSDHFFRSVYLTGKLNPTRVTTLFSASPATPRPSSTPLVVKRAILVGSQSKAAILDLEMVLEKLRTLRHPNVINLLAFKIDIRTDQWQFDILTEASTMRSLSDTLAFVEVLPLNKSKSYGIDLLKALDFYHRNGITHGRLHKGNVLFSRLKSGIVILKLADAAFQDALHQLRNDENSFARGDNTLLRDWRVPESISTTERKTRKVDIYTFGVVFAEMMFGLDLMHQFPDVAHFLTGARLSEPLADLLRDCFNIDPKKRSNAIDLTKYEFFRTDVDAIADSLTIKKSRTNSIGASQQSPYRRPRRDSDALHLRFATDWVEVGRLGKGAYGQVVKARNRVDGSIYAIKKITRKKEKELKDLLSEVHLLANLNNPYVVRYYGAWLDHDVPGGDSSRAPGSSYSGDSSEEDGYTTGSNVFSHNQHQNSVGLDFISSSGFPATKFAEDDDDEDDDNDEDSDDNEDSDGDEDIDDDEDSDDDTDDAADNDDEGDEGEDSNEDANKRDDGTNKVDKTIVADKDNTNGESIDIDFSNFSVETTRSLCIQMEFCEKLTLRDMIRQGVYEKPDQLWILTRQILEGLDHIHNSGVIHRDLKPENIFIDAKNNPRIGDFGLATTGHYNMIEDKNPSFSDRFTDGELTRNVGTSLYIAPECLDPAGGRITNKIDMFAFGIILFEMCYPLNTAMERVKVITDLRQKEHKVPETFGAPERVLQDEIILSLICHEPSKRPSSAELLRNKGIPIPIHENVLQTVLHSLNDESSPHYQQVMAAQVSHQSNSELKMQMWNLHQPKKPITNSFLVLQAVVKKQMVACFEHHGAVEAQLPSIAPLLPCYETRNDVFKMIDSSGTVLQMPYNLTALYAAQIGKQPLLARKTFVFENKYKATSRGSAASIGNAPEVTGAAIFDIVSRNDADFIMQEAEVIKVMDEIVDRIPSLKTKSICFELSHSDLLEIIFEFSRISSAQQGLVKLNLEKLNVDEMKWEQFSSNIRSSAVAVHASSAQDLAQFDFRGTPKECLTKLQSIFVEAKHVQRMEQIFTHFRKLVDLCKLYGVRRPIYITPLATFNEEFYRHNIMFQCNWTKVKSKSRQVVAAGGRYDNLIRDLRSSIGDTSTSPLLHAVGIYIASSNIAASMRKYQENLEKSSLKRNKESDLIGTWANRRCDILVASFDPEVLRSDGLKIVSTFWAADISAELAIDSNSVEELLAHYDGDKHSWLVIVKPEDPTNNRPDIKVKSLDRKEDSDIRRGDLLNYICNEIRDRDTRENTKDHTKLIRQHSQPEPSSTRDHSNIRVLASAHKGRKVNRGQLMDRAYAKVQETTKSMADAPVIAAIETSDDVMDMIRKTRLSDADSWKVVIQSVALPERQYVQQVQDLLLKFKTQYGASTRTCFVYSFKTGSCFPYDMML